MSFDTLNKNGYVFDYIFLKPIDPLEIINNINNNKKHNYFANNFFYNYKKKKKITL
jgi:hypothetical protein